MNGAGGKALDHHVRAFDQLSGDLDRLGPLHVERQALLGGVEVAEELGAVESWHHVLERCGAAQHVGSGLRLDADDAGSMIRQIFG